MTIRPMKMKAVEIPSYSTNSSTKMSRTDDDSSDEDESIEIPTYSVNISKQNMGQKDGKRPPVSDGKFPLTGFNFGHFNAIFAETLWMMLVCLTLPFATKLREYSDKNSASSSIRFFFSLFHYKQHFVFDRKFAMCFFYMYYTTNDKLECYQVDEDRSKNC